MSNSRLPRVSKKRAAEMAAGKHPKNSTFKPRRKWAGEPAKKRRKERRSRDWHRAHHSIERVYFVSAVLSCVVESCPTDDGDYLDNCHAHTGGMGRKADYTTVFPACRAHHFEHDAGRERFAEKYGLDIERCCAETERAFQLYGREVVDRAKATGRFQAWEAAYEERQAA